MKTVIVMLLSFFLLVACSSFAQKSVKIIGNKFPVVSGNSLAGDAVTLPDATKGQIALVSVAFVEKGQPIINSWAEPFLEKYSEKTDLIYYEVPMMNIPQPAAREYIDSGMRAGLDQKMHSKVVTYYGDFRSYMKELNMSDVKSGYVFLLDREGTIQFTGEGMMGKDDWKELQATIEKLEMM